MTDYPRCETQGRTDTAEALASEIDAMRTAHAVIVTRLARELSEARIALARCRDLASGPPEQAHHTAPLIARVASSCLPIDVAPPETGRAPDLADLAGLTDVTRGGPNSSVRVELTPGMCPECFGTGEDEWNRRCRDCDGTGSLPIDVDPRP